MHKVIRFLELMWLVIAIISTSVGIYHLFFTDIDDALFFFLLTALATFLYLLRRRQRRRLWYLSILNANVAKANKMSW